jgi:hypothetical protein
LTTIRNKSITVLHVENYGILDPQIFNAEAYNFDERPLQDRKSPENRKTYYSHGLSFGRLLRCATTGPRNVIARSAAIPRPAGQSPSMRNPTPNFCKGALRSTMRLRDEFLLSNYFASCGDYNAFHRDVLAGQFEAAFYYHGQTLATGHFHNYYGYGLD